MVDAFHTHGGRLLEEVRAAVADVQPHLRAVGNCVQRAAGHLQQEVLVIVVHCDQGDAVDVIMGAKLLNFMRQRGFVHPVGFKIGVLIAEGAEAAAAGAGRDLDADGAEDGRGIFRPQPGQHSGALPDVLGE